MLTTTCSFGGTLALGGIGEFPIDLIGSGVKVQSQFMSLEESNCCHSCNRDLPPVQVPGPPGAPGTDGTNGTNGLNAYTSTTALFVVPAVSSDVVVEVAASAWATVGQNVNVQIAGEYFVAAKPDATHITLTNLGYPNNAIPTTVIPPTATISPSGRRGATGASGAGVTLNQISPTTTKGDVLVDSGANNPAASLVRLAAGTDGQVLVSDTTAATGKKNATITPNATDATKDNIIPRFNAPGATVPMPLQESGMLISDTGALQSKPTGGDDRGVDAVDLQVSRSDSAEVASGDYSVIAGGLNNRATGHKSAIAGGDGNEASGNLSAVSGGDQNVASGTQSSVGGGTQNSATGLKATVGGGDSNTASNTQAVVAGGSVNTASGFQSAVGGGRLNVASGTYACVPGGDHNTASGDDSMAHGSRAVASFLGERAHASGNFAANGDAQSRDFIVRGQTTGATPVELFLDGAGATLTLPDNTAWMFRISISARRTDAADESAAYQILGCIDRQAGAASTAIVGTTTKTVIAEDNAGWDVDATADVTNGYLAITVTGEVAKNVNWVASVHVVQVQ